MRFLVSILENIIHVYEWSNVICKATFHPFYDNNRTWMYMDVFHQECNYCSGIKPIVLLTLYAFVRQHCDTAILYIQWRTQGGFGELPKPHPHIPEIFFKIRVFDKTLNWKARFFNLDNPLSHGCAIVLRFYFSAMAVGQWAVSIELRLPKNRTETEHVMYSSNIKVAVGSSRSPRPDPPAPDTYFKRLWLCRVVSLCRRAWNFLICGENVILFIITWIFIRFSHYRQQIITVWYISDPINIHIYFTSRDPWKKNKIYVRYFLISIKILGFSLMWYKNVLYIRYYLNYNTLKPINTKVCHQ